MALNIEYVIELVDNFTKTAQSIRSETQQMRAAVRDTSTTIKELAQMMVEVKQSTEAATSKLNEFAKKAQKAQKEIIGFSSIKDKILWHMKNFASIAVSLAPALSFEEIVKYSDAINTVEAVSDGARYKLGELKKMTFDLGTTTKFSAAEIAGGMQYMGMAGMNVNEILGATKDVTLLATAAGLDLASSADIVTNVMRGYGIETEDLGYAVDSMTKAFTTGNTNLMQLGFAMKYAGPIAHTFGIDFRETLASIAQLGNAGIQGTMAGTAIRNMIIRLVQPVGHIRKEFKRLNIHMLDSNGKFIGIANAIDLLNKKGVTRTGLLQVFGTKAGPAALDLIDQGTEKIRELAKSYDDVGYAQEVQDTKMQGLSGQWGLLTAETKSFFSSLGEGMFGDFLNAIIRTLRFILAFISEIVDMIGGIVATIGNIITRITNSTIGKLLGKGNVFEKASEYFSGKEENIKSSMGRNADVALSAIGLPALPLISELTNKFPSQQEITKRSSDIGMDNFLSSVQSKNQYAGFGLIQSQQKDIQPSRSLVDIRLSGDSDFVKDVKISKISGQPIINNIDTGFSNLNFAGAF